MVEVVVAVVDEAVFRGAPAFTAEEMQLARRDQYGINGFAILEGISVGVRRLETLPETGVTLRVYSVRSCKLNCRRLWF